MMRIRLMHSAHSRHEKLEAARVVHVRVLGRRLVGARCQGRPFSLGNVSLRHTQGVAASAALGPIIRVPQAHRQRSGLERSGKVNRDNRDIV